MIRLTAGSNDELVDTLVHIGVLRTPSIIDAFRSVDRRNFVWPDMAKFSYQDRPLPLGKTGQTISAPHMVAIMLENMNLNREDTVLEIGTGSGYSAALISKLADKGTTITLERNYDLYLFAVKNLLIFDRVRVIYGDGLLGYPPNAADPIYDVIVFAGSIKAIPEVLFKQIKETGSLMAPLGNVGYQMLTRIRRGTKEELGACTFVPIKSGVE